MFPPSSPSPFKAPSKKAGAKKKKDEPGLWAKVLPWALVAFGVGAIIVMIASNPKQRPLVCTNAPRGSHSLTSFGTCTEE